jgi:hypothetical protein
MKSSFLQKLMSWNLLLVSVFFTLFATTSFAQTSNSVDIFPPNSKPFGLSYEDHIKNYWNFALSLPNPDNPWNDETGEKCRNGQEIINSSIFYLPANGGGKSERVCKIPAGNGIFIPVLVGEFSQLELGKDAKPEDLPVFAKNDQDKMHVATLSIGDKKLDTTEVKKYGIVTGLFNLTFPEDNLFGTDAGKTLAAADGYYLITKPLAKGTYVIHTYGEMCTKDDNCPGGDNLKPDVNTTLIVQ